MYDPGCGVTVMDELSIHWRPLLAQQRYPPTDRPDGADRRHQRAYRLRRDITGHAYRVQRRVAS
jgi:hypothetical protein